MMENMFLKPVEYKIERTPLGVWRRYGYPTGESYHEFTSHRRVAGLPLIHHTRGINPETGRRKMAFGVVAIGQRACGWMAIGQFSLGVIGIGQATLGVLALGQLAIGVGALGQLALGVIFGLGQAATGFWAVGQVAWGKYVLSMANWNMRS